MHLDRRSALRLTVAAVLTVCGRAAIADEAAPHLWQPGDAPPAVEGIHLGDTFQQVVAVLGQPDSDSGANLPDADLRTLRYRGGALMVLIGKSEGVLRILLNRPEGGSIAGLRPGGRLSPLLKQWGEPTAGTPRTAKWPMGDWALSVRADLATQTILRLMLSNDVTQALNRTPVQGPLPDWATAKPDPVPSDAPAPAGN